SKPARTVPATPTKAPPIALAPSTQRTSRRHRLTLSTAIKAHAARDPADTISDYKFSPGSLTIHVGDSVTWTNAGPTAHTATADDHSFDTGILHKGQSA